MKTCKRCQKEYDPSYEFVEPAEDMELLLQLDDNTEHYCVACCEDLLERVKKVVKDF